MTRIKHAAQHTVPARPFVTHPHKPSQPHALPRPKHPNTHCHVSQQTELHGKVRPGNAASPPSPQTRLSQPIKPDTDRDPLPNTLKAPYSPHQVTYVLFLSPHILFSQTDATPGTTRGPSAMVRASARPGPACPGYPRSDILFLGLRGVSAGSGKPPIGLSAPERPLMYPRVISQGASGL